MVVDLATCKQKLLIWLKVNKKLWSMIIRSKQKGLMTSLNVNKVFIDLTKYKQKDQ